MHEHIVDARKGAYLVRPSAPERTLFCSVYAGHRLAVSLPVTNARLHLIFLDALQSCWMNFGEVVVREYLCLSGIYVDGCQRSGQASRGRREVRKKSHKIPLYWGRELGFSFAEDGDETISPHP